MSFYLITSIDCAQKINYLLFYYLANAMYHIYYQLQNLLFKWAIQVNCTWVLKGMKGKDSEESLQSAEFNTKQHMGSKCTVKGEVTTIDYMQSVEWVTHRLDL